MITYKKEDGIYACTLVFGDYGTIVDYGYTKNQALMNVLWEFERKVIIKTLQRCLDVNGIENYKLSDEKDDEDES